MDSEIKWKDMFVSKCRSSERKTFIKFLLDAVVDVNALNKYGKTMLSYAAECGNMEIVEFLAQKGADGNVTNSNGSKPLHLAAKHGHTEIVKFFLGSGIFVDSRDNNGDTPLHYVITEENPPESYLEVVHFLLNSKADVNAVNKEGYTPLLLAGDYAHMDLAELFISKGANVYCCDEYQATVLHYSCINGWLGIVRSLVEGDFSMNLDAKNISDMEPLALANLFEHDDIIKVLIESGATVKAPYHNGQKLIHYVSMCGMLDKVKDLVRMGCDLDAKSSEGDTPLLMAVRYSHLSVVEYLIDSGADVNCCDNRRITALHIACQEDFLEAVKYLVRKGCDLDAKDSDGYTPLLHAVKWAGFGVVEYLIDSGADINCCNKNKKTPLYLACRKGSLDVVKALTKKGSDLNGRESLYFDTPLHVALEFHNLEIVKHLLEAGADCNVQNYVKDSAFTCFLLSQIICLEGIVLFLEKGAFFQEGTSISDSLLIKDGILKDLNLCTLALMNQFNADLLKIYGISAFSKHLPPVDQLKIVNDTNMAQDIAQSVRNEIQCKGFCNVLEVRPMNLAILSAESLVKYYCT